MLFLIIFLAVLSIGLVFVNALLFTFPEWIVGLVLLLLVAVFILYQRERRARYKRAGKRIRKVYTVKTVLGSLVIGVLIVVVSITTFFNPYWNSETFRRTQTQIDVNTLLTKEEAKADAEYVLNTLQEVHPVFLKEDNEEVLAAYDQLMAKLDNSDTIGISEFYQEIQQVLSPLHDGHTTTYFNPLEAHYFKYIWEMRDSGYRFKAINGESIEEMAIRNSGLLCYDVDEWAEASLGHQIDSLELLNIYGFTLDEGITYTYENEEGKIKDIVCSEDDFVVYEDYLYYYGMNVGDSRASNNESFVSYELDDDLAVLTLNSCQYNDLYKVTVKGMFTKIKEEDIQNVIVDLRGNSGGNSWVANEFMKYLACDTYEEGFSEWRLGPVLLPLGGGISNNEQYKDLTFDGDVYVLTSNHTFSSGMKFAEYIQANDLGIIVGDKSGNSPSGYGEITIFSLPNSKLPLQVSTKIWHRIDTSVESNALEPDVYCEAKDALLKTKELIETKESN